MGREEGRDGGKGREEGRDGVKGNGGSIGREVKVI